MYFTQINLNKTKLAAVDLHNKLKIRQDVVLITELYLFRNKIAGLPRGYQAFVPEVEGDPPQMNRTTIMLPNVIKALRLVGLCHRLYSSMHSYQTGDYTPSKHIPRH